MCHLAWYKRYPRDFREGTRKLTFEERGFYGDILDLIYECGNELTDDDVANAHMLHADLRSYRRLKARLVELGKLHQADGCLRNARATAIATDAATRIAKARANGQLGGSKPRKSDQQSNVFNDEGGANGIPFGKPSSRENPDSKIQNRKQDSHAAVRPESHDSRAHESAPAGLPAAADGATLRAAIWRTGVRLLGPNSRPLIGRWVKDYGLGSTAQALADCEREVPADPRGWITAALQHQAGTRGNDRSPMASYHRVKAMMANGDPYADHDVSHLLALMPTETVQ